MKAGVSHGFKFLKNVFHTISTWCTRRFSPAGCGVCFITILSACTSELFTRLPSTMALSSWHCLLCGVRLTGLRQQARHMRNYNLTVNNPQRCDNVLRRNNGRPPVVITAPANAAAIHVLPPPGPGTVATIRLLTRRPRGQDSSQLYVKRQTAAHITTARSQRATLNFVNIQQDWKRFDSPGNNT